MCIDLPCQNWTEAGSEGVRWIHARRERSISQSKAQHRKEKVTVFLEALNGFVQEFLPPLWNWSSKHPVPRILTVGPHVPKWFAWDLMTYTILHFMHQIASLYIWYMQHHLTWCRAFSREAAAAAKLRAKTTESLTIWLAPGHLMVVAETARSMLDTWTLTSKWPLKVVVATKPPTVHAAKRTETTKR